MDSQVDGLSKRSEKPQLTSTQSVNKKRSYQAPRSLHGLPSLFPSLHSPIDNLKSYKSNADIYFERRNFVVKTVENRWELLQALKLRYKVFHREFIGKTFPLGIDTDRFDSLADILIIIDKNRNKVVGTYRFIISDDPQDFYSNNEFDLSEFLKCSGVKLELSRACVHPRYRTGTVIHLLWKGIGEYMKAVHADYLFGCSSLQTTDFKTIANAYHYLESKGNLSHEFGIRPTAKYFESEVENLINEPRISSSTDLAKSTIPALLAAYIKAGAKVCGMPALDKEYNCADFLTVLNRKKLANSYEKKFV